MGEESIFHLSIDGNCLLIYSSLGKGMYFEDGATQELGLGYLFFIAGLPFSFLALIGVKKDKNLLDSLDRLR